MLDTVGRGDPEAQVQRLRSRFLATRKRTERLAGPLSDADQTVQSMPDASPTKWHRAHTTWFFEAFVLTEHVPGYRVFNDDFFFLFNSYYEQAGPRHARPRRGMITRPSAEEVAAYRAHVDDAILAVLESEAPAGEAIALIELGCHHEEQHQELLLTDILHLFDQNPLRPAVYADPPADASAAARLGWMTFDGGLTEIGHVGDRGFAYDNEMPRHRVFLAPFRIADRLVTNGEWLAFMEDDGYATATLWLSDGWATVNAEGWRAPGYWRLTDDDWCSMTLYGERPIDPHSPVTHVSYFEADAFARWSGKRLPLETEWEHAVGEAPPAEADDRRWILPRPADAGAGLRQVFGEVWQWTGSAYLGYPGFTPAPGAVGEYNGKFMNGQFVLRGSSCATTPGHSRATYRNFFQPYQRWQFTGLRLAEDVE